MSPRVEAVLNEALKLEPAERAELVEQILTSFESPQRKQIDEAWAAEVEDRIDAYDRGEMHSTPASQVLDEIEKLKP